MWREVSDGTYDFCRSAAELQAIETEVTPEEVANFYQDWIKKGGRFRRKVVISGQTTAFVIAMMGSETFSKRLTS